MSATFQNLEGSGGLKNASVVDYSYSEDVTSLQPGDLSGGTSQVSLTGIGVEEDKVGSTHPNSLLMINNSASLTDSEKGTIDFRIKQVTMTDGNAAVIGDSVQALLNVDRTAPAVGSVSTYSLLDAINTYVALVPGVTKYIAPSLETTLDAIKVNFPGWKGNVWEHLKMLCAAVPIGPGTRDALEMVVIDNVLHFREALQDSLDVNTVARVSHSVSVSAFDAAQKVEVYNYNTSYKVNSVVHDLSGSRAGLGEVNQNVSISDSMQVAAGETLTKRFNIDAFLTSVNQPAIVSQISPLPYTGGGNGQYVVVGSDDLPIVPEQWTAEGGSLKVSLTENPGEIEITITAPVAETLPKVAGGNGLAPYKIGIETSGEEDYPALYVTGTGVFYNKTLHTFYTGADLTTNVTAPTIDNPFITNTANMNIRGIAAAQAYCGPSVTLTESTVVPATFGDLPGKMVATDSNKFRIGSVQHSADIINYTGISSVSFSDFDAKWSGKTFSNFTSIALTNTEALKFNEFTVIPLMESA